MTTPQDPASLGPGAPQTRHRKARDRSIALLLLGTVLLMPPIGTIFLIDTSVFGLPFPLIYIFIVWVLLIVGGAWLVRALQDGDVAPPPMDRADRVD